MLERMDGIAFKVIVLIILGCLTVLYWKRKKHFNLFKKLGIPGPDPSFFFGNLKEINEKTVVNSLLSWKKKYGPIYGYYLGTSPFLVVNDPDICKQIQIKDFKNFSDRPSLIEGGIVADKRFLKHVIAAKGDRWKEQRSILTPTFTTGKMKQMVPHVNESIDVLIKKIDDKTKAGEEFDIYEMFKGLTLDVIGKTAFGLKTNVQNDDQDPFLLGVKEFLNEDSFSGLVLLQLCLPEIHYSIYLFRKMVASVRALFVRNRVKELFESCGEVVKGRRMNPENCRQDLLQLMLDAEISHNEIKNAGIEHLTAGGYESHETKSTTHDSSQNKRAVYHLSDGEVVANTFLMIFAGYETTSTALGYTAHVLVNNPDLQEKIRQEVKNIEKEDGVLDYSSALKMKFLDQVFSEVLRYYPPVPSFINRVAASEIKYGQLTIPEKMTVQIPVTLMHRDADYWEDPDEFNPERFAPENRNKINPLAYQPFGAGPRNCIGMRFAQMEAKLALARVLKDYELVPGKRTEKGDITRVVKFIIMTPKEGVFVKAVKL